MYLLNCRLAIVMLTCFRILLLNQDRNAACGQHKEEIIRQLRELAKSEPGSDFGNAEIEPFNAFQSLASGECPRQPSMYAGCENDAQPMSFPRYEVACFLLCFDLVTIISFITACVSI